MAKRGCNHLEEAAGRTAPVRPSAPGCEDCLAIGGDWVHLRLCLACGHVGCCNDSPNRHASRHAHDAGHPVVRSYEPGEAWAYCYLDDAFVKTMAALPGEAADVHHAPPEAADVHHAPAEH